MWFRCCSSWYFVSLSLDTQIVAVISVFFICVSIFSFCIKTHPNMRVPVIYNKTITFRGKDNKIHTAWTLDKVKTDAHEAFFYIESICNAWFSFEITVRFMVREFSCHSYLCHGKKIQRRKLCFSFPVFPSPSLTLSLTLYFLPKVTPSSWFHGIHMTWCHTQNITINFAFCAQIFLQGNTTRDFF